jgi:thioredoxin 1
MSVSIANTNTYAELTREGFVIVDIYSTTCVPCKMLSRILEDLTLDYPFLNIVKVNVTDDPKLGADNHIEAVPTVKFLKDGEELETVVGLMDEDEIIEKISEYYYG